MNIFSKLRNLYPTSSPVVIEDEEGNVLSAFDIADHSYESSLKVLAKAYEDKEDLISKFDESDAVLVEQIKSCETALAKAEDNSEASKLKDSLISKRDKAELSFLTKTKKLNNAIEKASINVVEAADRFENEAAILIASASEEQMAIIKGVMEQFHSGDLDTENQREAIVISLHEAELIKGGLGSGRYDHHRRKIAEYQNELKQVFKEQDMDPDVEPQGGKVANEYGNRLNKIEKKIAHHTNKIKEINEKQLAQESSDKKYAEEKEKQRVIEWDKKQAASRANVDLTKGGEGSKGGKVIGHNSQGAPIYESTHHYDAMNFHQMMRDHAKKVMNAGTGHDHSAAKDVVKYHAEQAKHHEEQYNLKKAEDDDLSKGGPGSGRKALAFISGKHSNSGIVLSQDTDMHHVKDDGVTVKRNYLKGTIIKRIPGGVFAHNEKHERIGRLEEHHGQYSEMEEGKHFTEHKHEGKFDSKELKKSDDADLIKAQSDYSAIIVRDGDGKVLMLQRNDDSKQWMLPGGHIDEGETPLQAAVRELKEETNLEIPAKFFYECHCHDIDGGKKVHMFMAHKMDNISQSPLANIDSQNEAIQFEWMTAPQWLGSDLFKDTKEQMKRVLVNPIPIVG